MGHKLLILQPYAVQHQKLVSLLLSCTVAQKPQTAPDEQLSGQQHTAVRAVCTHHHASATPPSGHCYKYQCVTIWPVWLDKCLEKSLSGFLVALHDCVSQALDAVGLSPGHNHFDVSSCTFREAEMPRKKILQKKIPAWCTGWVNHCDRLTMLLLCKVECNVWEQRPG